MPGAGTHTTIIQHLASNDFSFQTLLGDPTLNADWAKYNSVEALRSRYAILGAMGPDLFYAMLDYGGDIQKFEDVLVEILGTFECVGELSGEINNTVGAGLNALTHDAWDQMQQTFKILVGILEGGILDAIVDKNNFWSLFLPLRQVDDYRQNWYWADFLHYVKTGCFTQKLLETCQTYSSDPNTTSFLKAYSLGYLTHYVADTVGHAYVNRIVESPWRNYWQRHHLVENFIDAYVWDHWHDPSGAKTKPADEAPLDLIVSQSVADGGRTIGKNQPYHYSRLNDLCNIGSMGADPTLDAAIAGVVNEIQSGLFKFGLSSRPVLQAPDDPSFITWANFMSDAMRATYPPTIPLTGLQEHPVKLSSSSSLGCPSGGYPSAEDVIGAYGVYRLVLSVATEDQVDAPVFPDFVGDIEAVLTQIANQVAQALGSIPAPPSIPTSGGFNIDNIWNAAKSYANWLGQVATAVVGAVADIIEGWINLDNTIDSDEVKAAFWFLNSALFALYHAVRMPLVMSGYSGPLTQDLTGTFGPLSLQTLWTTMSEERMTKPYPVEPMLSERDFASDSSHPHSPYRPYFLPSTTQPVRFESPVISHPERILMWKTPDDMLEQPMGTDVMLSVDGPAPATTVTAPNPVSVNVAVLPQIQLETFDGSQRYFGGIFANCAVALSSAIPYVSGAAAALPAGTILPDYNLDSDRGYAWLCWDVDYKTMLPWNGCDPFPEDTITRAAASGPGSIDWGSPSQSQRVADFNYQGTDPFSNKQRNGTAFVNAAALSTPGVCDVQELPFSFLTLDPNDTKDTTNSMLDECSNGSLVNTNSPTKTLTFDYQFAPSVFVDNFSSVFTNPKTGGQENGGRLILFLRAHAQLRDATKILVNAVTISLGAGSTVGPLPVGATQAQLATAVAQLAMTGRASFASIIPPALAPDDASLTVAVTNANPGLSSNPALASAVKGVLDDAYRALWAIRSNESGWKSFRFNLGWIAVSGIDDTPHRPVNVPSGPYPQFDISFSINDANGHPFGITTRYMVASANSYIGPTNSPTQNSFVNPDPAVLTGPASPTITMGTPILRVLPADTPSIPAGDEIIIYIHGGGSRAEEAVGLADWLIIEGQSKGKSYTVISFDMPNSAYGVPFQVTAVTGSPYDPSAGAVVSFEKMYVIGFIEALDKQLGNLKDRVAAVMGGSLGGNMSVLLSSMDLTNHNYLKTIVAWSVTSMAPSTSYQIIPTGPLAAYIGGLVREVNRVEAPGTEASYLHDMYFKPIADHPLPFVPAQPIMWYRGDDLSAPFFPDWSACKASFIDQSRFDRYEIYSETSRRWTTALDLELVYLSFQANCAYQEIATSDQSRLMLCAGAKDNYAPVEIYNSTLDVARLIRRTAHGKAQFWLDTGHSIHDERPNLFAKEIVYFLMNLDAGDSPNAESGAPLPAAPSRTDE